MFSQALPSNGSDITHLFDLSDAYRALKLKAPCRIIAERMSGEYGCMFPADPSRTVYVDLERLDRGATPGCDCDNCHDVSLPHTIAHELVHWAQVDHVGPQPLVRAKMTHAYSDDPFEKEARALSEPVARLIRRK